MEAHDKTRSKFQKKINGLHEMIAELTIALEKRKIYSSQSSDFVRMLLASGRTTKEELNLFFKPIKRKK